MSMTGFILAVALLLRPAAASIILPPRSYIVQCADENNFQSLESAIGPFATITRRIELPPLYRAASIAFNASAADRLIDETVAALAADTAAYRAVAPLHDFRLYQNLSLQHARLDPAVLGRLLGHGLPRPFAPHAMTQIDMLHGENVTGAGIKVAIISSGINHQYPFFGDSCLGEGCLVENYYNYVPDECAPTHHDVRDCNGAGTLIAGSIAAPSNPDDPKGVVSVSPGAKLAVYRVAGDINVGMIMDAIVRAVRDGASVIVVPFSTKSAIDADHPLARLVAAVAASRSSDGVAFIFGQGGYALHGSFSADGWLNLPSGGGTVVGAGWLHSPHRARLAFKSAMAVHKALSGPLPSVLETHGDEVEFNMTDNDRAGAMNPRSSWGPPMDMAVRPQFVLPAGQINTALPNRINFEDYEGYLVSSLLAGIYALFGERNGGRVDPALFEASLTATATPRPYHKNNPDRPAPVSMQGAGLVQAHDAAHAAFTSSTTVSPVSLSFNDTESAPEFLTLTITNRGSSGSSDDASGEIEYTIDHHPFRTMYLLNKRRYLNAHNPTMLNATTQLVFSQKSVTLSRGESAEIRVSPDVSTILLDDGRLPLWSGQVTIRGSDGSLLRVPYQGATGRIRDVVALGAGDAVLGSRRNMSAHSPRWSMPCVRRRTDAFDDGACPQLVATIRITSPLVRMYAVPAPLGEGDGGGGSRNVSAVAGEGVVDVRELLAPELEIAGSPQRWRSQGMQLLGRWHGLYRNGSAAVPGTYRFAVKALRLRGNADNENDYDVAGTNVFTIYNAAEEEVGEP